jgi:hypothetical protein
MMCLLGLNLHGHCKVSPVVAPFLSFQGLFFELHLLSDDFHGQIFEGPEPPGILESSDPIDISFCEHRTFITDKNHLISEIFFCVIQISDIAVYGILFDGPAVLILRRFSKKPGLLFLTLPPTKIVDPRHNASFIRIHKIKIDTHIHPIHKS